MDEQEIKDLRLKLCAIAQQGWVRNQRQGNAGGVGNTLEDLLGVPENNLSMPDFGSWELKAQRKSTSSLLTLFHKEPQPREAAIVPRLLLPLYGWPHVAAGLRYPATERSFRQTIPGNRTTGRGFYLEVNREAERVEVHFDSTKIDKRFDDWKQAVASVVGMGDLRTIPYWTFEDLTSTLVSKLHNTIYYKVDTKKIDGEEYFRYISFLALVNPSLQRLLSMIESGEVFVDFDARTRHNHGTKFRINQNSVTELYEVRLEI